jgi:hypothetical protein
MSLPKSSTTNKEHVRDKIFQNKIVEALKPQTQADKQKSEPPKQSRFRLQ